MKQRNLSIEILRILSMLLIAMWHVNVHFMPAASEVPSGLDTLMNGICALFSFHVNLFILITGYFGVHDNKKGIVRTVVLVYFYDIIFLILMLVLGLPLQPGRSYLLPFSRGSWWFMTNYLILLFIAPAFETYIKHVPRRTFIRLVVALLFVDVWIGFAQHNVIIYQHGYSLLNFITVYLLGTCIRLFGGGNIKVEALPYSTHIYGSCFDNHSNFDNTKRTAWGYENDGI